MTITIETRIENPRPTTTGVTGGVDYDASLWVTDEAGERSHWDGELTYAPGADVESLGDGPGIETIDVVL